MTWRSTPFLKLGQTKQRRKSRRRRHRRRVSFSLFAAGSFAVTFDNDVRWSARRRCMKSVLTRTSPRGYITVRRRTQAVHFYDTSARNGCFYASGICQQFPVPRPRSSSSVSARNIREYSPRLRSLSARLLPTLRGIIVFRFVISRDACFRIIQLRGIRPRGNCFLSRRIVGNYWFKIWIHLNTLFTRLLVQC